MDWLSKSLGARPVEHGQERNAFSLLTGTGTKPKVEVFSKHATGDSPVTGLQLCTRAKTGWNHYGNAKSHTHTAQATACWHGTWNCHHQQIRHKSGCHGTPNPSAEDGTFVDQTIVQVVAMQGAYRQPLWSCALPCQLEWPDPSHHRWRRISAITDTCLHAGE